MMFGKRKQEGKQQKPVEVPDDLCPFLRFPCLKAKCHLWLVLNQTYTEQELDGDGKPIGSKKRERQVGFCSMKWTPQVMLELNAKLKGVSDALTEKS